MSSEAREKSQKRSTYAMYPAAAPEMVYVAVEVAVGPKRLDVPN